MSKIPLNEIKNELDNTPHGGKRATVERYARAFGVSPDTIYRKLRQKYGKQKKVERDKRIPQELIDKVAIIKEYGKAFGAITTNARAERELSTERCIKKLKNWGHDGAEQLTVSSVNRRLREAGYRQKDPRVRVECEYANQEHQIDFTRSKYFQIVGYDNGAEDWILKVSGKSLSYKKDDKSFRLWIAQIKDSFSRIRIARAYGATGESAPLGIAFLRYVWVREEDDHPLTYLPTVLKSDQGAFMKANETKKFLEDMGIERKMSKPYNKESQGKIESAHASLWQCFELDWAIDLGKGTEISLSRYNKELMNFCTEDTKKSHPRFREYTREQYYRMGLELHEQRETTVDILNHASRDYERTVKEDKTVSIDNVEYICPADTIGKRIRVLINHNGEVKGEVIKEDREMFLMYRAEPTAYDDFEHRDHQTYKQKVKQSAKDFEKEDIRLKESDEDWQKIKEDVQNVKHVEPDSAFAMKEEQEKNEYFDNERHARKWIGKNLPGKDTFRDYEDILLPLLDSTLKRENIEQVVNKIGQMKTLKQEG